MLSVVFLNKFKSRRYAPLLNPFVSVFLSVQDSGWSFSSGIISVSGAFHRAKNSVLNSRKDILVANGRKFS